MQKPLQGKVALVAGGTRGAGRGIAVALGEAGATVYVTGRSVRGNLSDLRRNETIEETAELVTAAGGTGIAVRADHSRVEDVQHVIERIKSEQAGQLDVLVNDIWGGEELSEWGKPFWEQSLENGLLMQRRGIHTHLITSHFVVPLMIARQQGLVIEITDGIDYRYRGNLYYSLAKASVIHVAQAMAAELQSHHITALSVTPGFLRSEEVLDHFGVTEQNWRDAASQDPNFLQSETPLYIGRAIAALAADPNVSRWSGQALSSWRLSEEYDFTDQDGRRPHWGRYAQEQGF